MEPSIVELVLPAGEVAYPIELGNLPAVHLIVRGTGAGTVLREPIEVRGVASVEVRDLRFGELIWSFSDALTLRATHSISLHNVAFLDQRGTYQTTSHGVTPFDFVASLETGNGGAIHLSDVSLLGARGAWPAIRMVAPGGTVAITRTLVADTDRPPFFVGIADTITVEDSVLFLPAGTKDLLVTNWPPDGVTFRRSTIVADTPEVLVAPGNNPQTPPSLWMPTVLSDSTLYTRGPDPGNGPGLTLERSTIESAPTTQPDFAAVRTRAEALAPVERAAILPLLDLQAP
ncbi:MAG: hypothetical protein Q8P18_08290 [Pseudomonadota bacterium]|nr:hypothetical protein [Pseudomonadota bacterium]